MTRLRGVTASWRFRVMSRRVAEYARHSVVVALARIRSGSIGRLQSHPEHVAPGNVVESLCANLWRASSTVSPEYCIETSATERPCETENRDATMSSRFVSMGL